MRRFIAVLVSVLAVPAFADPAPTVIETHGIEIEVPGGWSVTNKGSGTTIAPTRYKGRAIEVVELAKPLNRDLVVEFLKAARIETAELKELQRDGAPLLVATGKLAVKGSGELDVDLLAVQNPAQHATLLLSFIKGDSDPVLRNANDKLLASARVAGPKITLMVAKPTQAGLAGVPQDLAARLGAIGASLDGLLRFPRSLPIKVRECGVVNAFYSPTDHSISICHELWDDTLRLFKKAGFDDARADKLTRGTVLFAFFHEFGHALVGEFGLAITGKGEDAADEVATIILGYAKDFGRDSALSGAQWFETQASQPDHHNVFYDEHSFDSQRVVSIACLLYGSNQREYAQLMQVLKIPSARLGRCVRDFNDRLKAWNSLLEPHMRHVQK